MGPFMIYGLGGWGVGGAIGIWSGDINLHPKYLGEVIKIQFRYSV